MRVSQNRCWVCGSAAVQFQSLKTECCDKILCSNCTAEHQCSTLVVHGFETKCMRCAVQKASLQCNQCTIGVLCAACDWKVHQKGKFALHQRTKYEQKGLEAYQQHNPYKLSMNPLITKMNKGSSQNDLVAFNIVQTWNQLRQQLQAKFQEVLDLVVDKKKEILNKIEKRRDKELSSYQEAFRELEEFQGKGNNDINLRKSQIMDKLECLQKRLESFQIDYSHGQERKSKFSIANCQFDSIKNLVDRIQIKGLLLKIVSQPQKGSKSKMRTSTILTNNSGSESATIYRTPKNGKSKMSISTIEGELQGGGIDRPIEEEERQKANTRSGKLQKVKSEKLFSKGSGSLKAYFYDRIKKKGQ